MTTEIGGSVTEGPVNRHAPTAVERQRSQLERLLKDPAKPAYIPPPPKEKTIRPAREMMKNVQGSSAGAGSGEFHVYKASRRREYERLKLLEETSQKEIQTAEFEKKRRQAQEEADARTSRNRAKRLKKKERSKTKGNLGEDDSESRTRNINDTQTAEPVIKKRRLVSGKELVFRRPGGDSEGEDSDLEHGANGLEELAETAVADESLEHPQIVDVPRITIHED